nr:uncharacterized protein LOC123745577 [Procambarus clarkii]
MTQPVIVQMDNKVVPRGLSSFVKTYRNYIMLMLGVFSFGVVIGIGPGVVLGRYLSTSPDHTATKHGPTNSTTTVGPLTVTVPSSTEATLHHIDSTVTAPGTDWEKKILQQEKDLIAVGCRPTPHVIYVKTELAPEDDLGDKDLYPEWVVVGRCLASCSYCQPPQQCLPTPGTLRNKTFVVRATDDSRTVHRKRQVDEDTDCSCQ